ncbi:MAG: RNA polymerase sigma-70 factor [Bacteroidota bacterium]
MQHIEQWFQDYYPMLTAYAWKMIQDEEVAKGLVQELFLHLFEKQDKLSIPNSPKSYLFQAVRNRCLNHLKKEQRIQKIPLEEVPETSGQLIDPVEAAELEYLLHSWIQELPSACQQIFRLSRFEGKTNQDIAELLNISKRTVEGQISKALKTLRKRIKELEISEAKRTYLMSILL